MGHPLSQVLIEGTAFRLADILVKSKIPGVVQMSLIKNVVQLGMTEANYVVEIIHRPELHTTQLDFEATFREPQQAGETWWAHWYVDVPQPSALSTVGSALVAEITSSRRLFARLVEQTAADPGGTVPSTVAITDAAGQLCCFFRRS